MSRSPKFSPLGVLLAIGLVFGDIGTSPLYVFRAVVSNKTITEDLVLGSLSLIFWSLTLMVSIKYVTFVLRADNQGEGGILALYNIVKRRGKFLFFVALLGLSGLISEAVITPAISVLASVEGLTRVTPEVNTTFLGVLILFLLFSAQNVGSNVLGLTFGIAMIIWFALLAVSGAYYAVMNPIVFQAFDPGYAIKLLIEDPQIGAILGAVFLCITGVEALYSDLGHAGRMNIRVAWVLVKISLVLNYFGQGAYLLRNHLGEVINPTTNIFYQLFNPYLLPLVIISATTSTIIASQAVISGLFSLVSSGISLNLLPKILVKYPGDFKGQVFIPVVNSLLGLLTILVAILFRNSWNLEHAYGLSVNVTLLCTSILFLSYLNKIHSSKLVSLIFLLFTLIELYFLKSNLSKFVDGAYFTVFLTLAVYLVLYSWSYGYSLLKDIREFVEINPFIPKFVALSKDESAPIFSDNIVYLTESSIPELIESRIIYSITRKRPKRALTYFFVHLEVTDKPYDESAFVTTLMKGCLYKIHFKLGFKVRPNIQKRFNEIYEKLIRDKEFEDLSGSKSLALFGVPRCTTFIVLNKQPYLETDLTLMQSILLRIWRFLRESTVPRWRFFDLDDSLIYEEKVPAFAKLPGAEILKRLT